VYYALLSEALNRPGVDQDPDALATLVIETLLHGADHAAEPVHLSMTRCQWGGAHR
jgi:hypothetical protein